LAGELLWSAWRAEAYCLPRTSEVLTLGEAAGWMLHALNNHLNGMVMHAALLQAQAPEPLRERAAAIRRLGGEAARLARAAQAVRPWRPETGETADLYGAFLEAWQEAGEENLSCELPPAGPIIVPASRAGLRRLLGLVLRVARGSAREGTALCAALSPAAGAQFRMPLPGVPAEHDEQGQVPLPPAPNAFAELQRQAAAWLAREQGTRLEVVAAAGAVELRLGWPPAPVA
jgi:hypothetical protein